MVQRYLKKDHQLILHFGSVQRKENLGGKALGVKDDQVGI